MKNLERDFTLIAEVPDDVNLDDCEVVIHHASASYRKPDGEWVTVEYQEEDDLHDYKGEVDIVVLSTRFVNPATGEELESD